MFDNFDKPTLSEEFVILTKKISFGLFIIAIIIIVQGYFLYWAEDNIIDPVDGIYKNIIAIGGETPAPESGLGRFITILAVFEGLVMAAYIVVLAAVFSLQGGTILKKNYRDHIVICGWNFQGRRIVETLLETQKDQIVVIDPNNRELNFNKKKVFFVKGDPTSDKTLDDAGIMNAKTAIILTDLSLEPLEADSRSLLIGLAIESKNSNVYTCAQIIDSKNEIHMRRANVDEIILLDVVGADLAAASAINQGSSMILSELVRYDQGSEIYRFDPPLPNSIVGKNAQEASDILHKSQVILIGVETTEKNKIKDDVPNREKILEQFEASGRAILVNPQNYIIGDNDSIFVISDDDPKEVL